VGPSPPTRRSFWCSKNGDGPERTQLELSVQLALGTPLTATRRYAAAETGQAYSRALALCRQTDAPRQRFTALRGLWQFHLLRAELRPARALGEELFGQAQQVNDPSLLLEAHRALGSTLYWCGEFAEARAHSAHGITQYDRRQHHTHAFVYGLDPGVTCLTYMGLVLWGLGYPDQAYRRGQESLTLARELAHPVSLTFALTFTAMLHQFHREAPAAQACIEADIAIATEQGFLQWIQMDTFIYGWALAEQGRMGEGVAKMRQGMAAWRAMGADLHRPYFLALLAEARAKMGQVEEGLRLLAEAFAIVRHNGESLNEAELYRLQGQLLLAQAGTRPTLE
jgi:predicted ATPase